MLTETGVWLVKCINPLSANLTMLSRIVWVCLTILSYWHLKGLRLFVLFISYTPGIQII